MKIDLRLFGIAIFLIAIPVLMALPQSFLVSDIVLSQDTPSYKEAPGEEGRMPLFGKITAIRDSSLQISNPNGEKVTVKLTPQTEFRKDRQAAKRSDFKVADVQVGDHLIARGAVQDNVFVPKFVMVIEPEQWKRMQEMGGVRPGTPVTFGPGGVAQKPAEPPH